MSEFEELDLGWDIIFSITSLIILEFGFDKYVGLLVKAMLVLGSKL